ncbi:hypothetical protein ACU4GH_08725 [Bradyrhizobium betae]
MIPLAPFVMVTVREAATAALPPEIRPEFADTTTNFAEIAVPPAAEISPALAIVAVPIGPYMATPPTASALMTPPTLLLMVPLPSKRMPLSAPEMSPVLLAIVIELAEIAMPPVAPR